MTPAGFYHRYRTAIINNCARAGERIHWLGAGVNQANDEILGPGTEDHILLSVIKEIDPRLPDFIRTHYQLKLENRRLMDIRSDILNNVSKYIIDIESAESLSALTLRSSGIVAAS